MNLIEQIKIWYRGKYVPPPDNDFNSSIVIISPGHYEKPLLAKIIQFLIFKHLTWTITTMITMAAITTTWVLSQKRPFLTIELTKSYLVEDIHGTSFLLYRLKNAEKTAYYKKGHMIFELPENNERKCKKFYEKNKIDTLQPGENSAIHQDNIDKLDDEKSYKAQLLITYKDSKGEFGKKYLSWANLEFYPNRTGSHVIVQKTLGVDYLDEKEIEDSIDHCKEFN